MLIFFPRCPVSNPLLQHQSDKKTKQKKQSWMMIKQKRKLPLSVYRAALSLRKATTLHLLVPGGLYPEICIIPGAALAAAPETQPF